MDFKKGWNSGITVFVKPGEFDVHSVQLTSNMSEKRRKKKTNKEEKQSAKLLYDISDSSPRYHTVL